MKSNGTDLNETEYKDKSKIKDELLKYLISVNNQHLFNINGTRVMVVFSTQNSAPDIESALVKIASNRGN